MCIHGQQHLLKPLSRRPVLPAFPSMAASITSLLSTLFSTFMRFRRLLKSSLACVKADRGPMVAASFPQETRLKDFSPARGSYQFDKITEPAQQKQASPHFLLKVRKKLQPKGELQGHWSYWKWDTGSGGRRTLWGESDWEWHKLPDHCINLVATGP